MKVVTPLQIVMVLLLQIVTAEYLAPTYQVPWNRTNKATLGYKAFLGFSGDTSFFRTEDGKYLIGSDGIEPNPVVVLSAKTLSLVQRIDLNSWQPFAWVYAISLGGSRFSVTLYTTNHSICTILFNTSAPFLPVHDWSFDLNGRTRFSQYSLWLGSLSFQLTSSDEALVFFTTIAYGCPSLALVDASDGRLLASSPPHYCFQPKGVIGPKGLTLLVASPSGPTRFVTHIYDIDGDDLTFIVLFNSSLGEIARVEIAPYNYNGPKLPTLPRVSLAFSPGGVRVTFVWGGGIGDRDRGRSSRVG